jgi:hydrogenase expression/formation protein HypD
VSVAASRDNLRRLVSAVAEAAAGARDMALMEICGTHTVSLFRSGIKSLMPASVRLISGPGCPVCVTSCGYLDTACELAARKDVIIATYGDMVRVPGRTDSLEAARGRGAAVEVVYSARDAVKLARENPRRNVVFLAVGFETTTPATAAAAIEAEAAGLDNFFILPGHKVLMPALEALLSADDSAIDGFLCPGHVSVILGAAAYRPIAQECRKPCVVVGFEPANMLEGILRLIRQVAAGQAKVENAYGVAVTEAGNQHAQAMIARVFEPAEAQWRAMGNIPASGLALRGAYARLDARAKFGVEFGPDHEPPGCRCGQVIQGRIEPPACGLFGVKCSPATPVGPCMVSGEGTCAAWYKYNLHRPGR